MKKTLLLVFTLVAMAGSAWAQAYFDAVAPTGQTLRFYYLDDGVSVGRLYNISGTLIIPSTVSHNGYDFTVKEIKYNGFYNCDITSVTIPNTVTRIRQGAFWDCSGLTSVTIPNSVTHIDSSAFEGCTYMTSITIPGSVAYIGGRAFAGCYSLSQVNYTGTIAQWCNISFSNDGWGWSTPLTYAEHLYIDGSDVTNLVIPNEVAEIKPNVFRNYSSLTSVTIGNSVTSIGSGAFCGCSGLTSITIPNSVTSIGNYAFGECSGLTSVTIGNSVTSIGYSAFYGCSGLTSVTIPNSVTSIGNDAFAKCSGLTSVTIGNSVTSIGNDAFAECSGLTSVTIPNSVTSIGVRAFQKCNGLTSVTIGNSVTSIGNYAFQNCTTLGTITFKGLMPPTIGENTFYMVPSDVAVSVPCGTLALYMPRLPSSWSNYTETTISFEAQSSDESMGTVQVLNQPTCTNPNAVVYAVPAAGHHFDHWSDGSTTNPYSLTVNENMVLTAYFAADGTQGIDDVDGINAKVTAADGRIVVTDADGLTVTLYDAVGRQLAVRGSYAGAPVHFDVPASGTYLVKVGSAPARRIVVVK